MCVFIEAEMKLVNSNIKTPRNTALQLDYGTLEGQENVEKDVGKDGDQHWKTVHGPRPSLEALEPLAILSEEQETDMLEEGEISDTIRL
ncbi:hypothetical protein F2Q69_00009265 [Brassica cretica]|uniref:Uncharacterized protein n=1 Tax=Brassica cretica TaxID=69181 RepID=A0A8S9P4E2_BRACR|nr:hypothetical protein F2Q69_00009265 [Brassica cretica]